MLVLEPQVQALAQAAALAQVWEPEPVREPQLVQPLQLELAVEPLELVREPEPEPVRVREPLQLELELAQVRVLEPPLARKPARRPELVAIPEQARELRVSRQLELQQHRLLAAAQELPPYRPVLPMKALC